MMDLGFNYVGKVNHSSTNKQFFTVEDGEDVYIYNDLGDSKRDIRDAIHLAFIELWDYTDECRVAGRYPNYWIEEVQ